MEAGTGNRTVPNWRSLYESAVLELNPYILNQRIEAAESAVRRRIEDLSPSSDTGEAEELVNALNVLRDLRKLATERTKENGDGAI